MSPVLHIQLDRTRVLLSVLDQWETGAAEILTAWDAEELLLEMVNLCTRARATWEASLRRVFFMENPTVAALQQERAAIERLLADLRTAVIRVQQLTRQASYRDGQPKRGVAELEVAAKDLQTLQGEVADKWPVCNQAELAEARARIARGEGYDLDEVFAELAGVDQETWRAHVEMRKRELLRR